jgi:hypothetical protein
MERHRRRWKDARRRYTTPSGRWLPVTAGDAELRPIAATAHGGFGERSGETGREQFRYRAPGPLSDIWLLA